MVTFFSWKRADTLKYSDVWVIFMHSTLVRGTRDLFLYYMTKARCMACLFIMLSNFLYSQWERTEGVFSLFEASELFLDGVAVFVSTLNAATLLVKSLVIVAITESTSDVAMTWWAGWLVVLAKTVWFWLCFHHTFKKQTNKKTEWVKSTKAFHTTSLFYLVRCAPCDGCSQIYSPKLTLLPHAVCGVTKQCFAWWCRKRTLREKSKI